MYSLKDKKPAIQEVSTSLQNILPDTSVKQKGNRQDKFRPISNDDFINGKSNNSLQFQQDDDVKQGGSGATKATMGPDASNYKEMQIGTNSDLDINAWDSKPSSKSMDLRFDGTFPKGVKKKLTNVANTLVYRDTRSATFGSFPEDYSISLAIGAAEFAPLSKDDKKKYAGDTVFEFVRLKNAKGRKPVVYIRELGKDNSSDGNAANSKKIFSKYFTADATWSNEELDLLYNSVAKIPEGILSKVPKIVFSRAAVSKDDTGERKPDTLATHSLSRTADNTITVFDLAFEKSQIRFGDGAQGFSDSLAQTIVHEIGHALDSRQIQKTLKARHLASEEWRNAMAERTKFEGVCADPADLLKAKCSEIDDKNRKTFQTYLDKDKENEKSRTETGEEYNPYTDQMFVEDTKADTEFLKALKADGDKAATLYASKSKQENFAELFSLYILDTARFKLVFPNVYAYFLKTFPK